MQLPETILSIRHFYGPFCSLSFECLAFSASEGIEKRFVILQQESGTKSWKRRGREEEEEEEGEEEEEEEEEQEQEEEQEEEEEQQRRQRQQQQWEKE